MGTMRLRWATFLRTTWAGASCRALSTSCSQARTQNLSSALQAWWWHACAADATRTRQSSPWGMGCSRHYARLCHFLHTPYRNNACSVRLAFSSRSTSLFSIRLHCKSSLPRYSEPHAAASTRRASPSSRACIRAQCTSSSPWRPMRWPAAPRRTSGCGSARGSGGRGGGGCRRLWASTCSRGA